MKVLAVIPARGGSKGVPRKNIALINQRPLISYTIEASLGVDRITDVIVSTDDEEIAQVSENLGAQVPFIRPKELASDTAESAPVIIHALEYMEAKQNLNYEVVMMLQPTAPLRTANHINQALDLYSSQTCDSVVSIISVGGYHPFRMKRLVGNKLVNYIEQGFWDMRPRQVLPETYIRNGAIYLINRDALLEYKMLIGQNCLGLKMGDEESVNIDTRLDFIMAELLLKERN